MDVAQLVYVDLDRVRALPADAAAAARAVPVPPRVGRVLCRRLEVRGRPGVRVLDVRALGVHEDEDDHGVDALIAGCEASRRDAGSREVLTRMWLVMYVQTVLAKARAGVEFSRLLTFPVSVTTASSCDIWSVGNTDRSMLDTHEEQEVHNARLDEDRHDPLALRHCIRAPQVPADRASVLPMTDRFRYMSQTVANDSTYQVLYEIINVAAPVVASVVQYDDSWTCLQNGGLVKSPTAGASMSLTTQKVISPDVTGTQVREHAATRRGDGSPKDPAKSANGMRSSQRSRPDE